MWVWVIRCPVWVGCWVGVGVGIGYWVLGVVEVVSGDGEGTGGEGGG